MLKQKMSSMRKQKLIRILCLSMICIISFIIWLIGIRTSKNTVLSIEYEPTGTMQFQSEVFYTTSDGEETTLQEKVENFTVNFDLDRNIKDIEQLEIQLGDQSGTVRIKKISIISNHKELTLENRNILDFFSIENIDSIKTQDGYLEIYTYDISLTKMEKESDQFEEILKPNKNLSWAFFLGCSVFIYVLIEIILKNKYIFSHIVKHGLVLLGKIGTLIRKKILSYYCIENYFLIGTISIIICFVFSNQISEFVYNHMVKYQDLKISCSYALDEQKGNAPELIDNYYEDKSSNVIDNVVDEKKYGFYDFTELKKAIVVSKKIDIITPNISKYEYGYFKFTDADSYVVLHLPVYPNTCLTISTDNNAWALKIEDEEGKLARLIAFENTTEANSIKIYPFATKDYAYVLFANLFIYVCLFMILFLLGMFSIRFLSWFAIKNKYMQNSNSWIMFICIFTLYVLFTSITYYVYRDRLEIGPGSDAYYYMHPQILDENGKFSIKVISEYLFTFRGYITIITAVVANTFSKVTGMDMSYFYFWYNGAIVAFTVSVAMPKLYSYLTKKKASNIMCLSIFCLLFLFWRNLFYYAMADIPAAMFAICGIAYALEASKMLKIKDAFWSGVFWGLSVCYRSSYSFIFYVLCIWIIGSFMVQLLKKKIQWKRFLKVVFFAGIGLVIITVPQFILNYLRGHVGIFPYYQGGWVYDINSASTIEVTWFSFLGGFHKYNLGGMENLDKQLAMIDQPYFMSKYYAAADLLYIAMINPLQFLIGYFKRLFWALSAGLEVVYFSIPSVAEENTLLTMLNYVLIGNAIYILCLANKEKIILLKHKILFIMITIFSIGIQNLSHIERRYYLFFLILIYFINSFICVDYYKTCKEQGRKVSIRYIIKMAVFVFGCYMVNQTILYNFL